MRKAEASKQNCPVVQDLPPYRGISSLQMATNLFNQVNIANSIKV
jgi:hypothetical protein